MVEHSPANAEALRIHLLVLRCQTGDERAFAELFGRFGSRTLRYLNGLVGDDAEDVQQEVWLTVYRGIRGLSNPGAFRTWLFQSTRHRAIDFLRKRKRELSLLEDAAVEWPGIQPSADEFPIGALEQSELADAMAALAPAHREVVLLRYQDDLSYAEIALVVGCTLGTVRSRLHHARRRLQELTSPG